MSTWAYKKIKRKIDPIFAESERRYAREYQRRLKYKVMSHYSGGQPMCACCGEMSMEFLSIDHVKGGGIKHRKEVGNLYPWLVKNKYPDGFRVLCMNCNHAIGHFKICPHQIKE